MIASSSATTALTGGQCSPNTVHWRFDSHMLSHSTGGALVKAGGDSWFFVAADYAFGHALAEGTTAVAKQAGAETINCVKQAREFGLASSMQLAALPLYVTDVHALGLDVAQGRSLTETFYWDLNDRTRGFTDRVRAKTPSNLPNMDCAGTSHSLKAAESRNAAQIWKELRAPDRSRTFNG